MKKILLSLFVLCMVCVLYTNCKKSSNTTAYTPSAFADSLRNTCTKPFVGPNDTLNFHLPTAFTPNGDGINDVYWIAQRANFTNFQLTVYDTTGKLVFETTNPLYRWWGADTATGKLSTQYKFYVEVNYTTVGGKSGSGGTYVYLLSSDSARRCVNIVPADSSKYEFPDQFADTGFTPSFTSFETFCN